MPNCRNCGARLSKFDSDLCPVCGIKNPLQGVSSETVEVTSQIELSELAQERKVIRRRKTMLILFFTLGFTGAAFFYVKRILIGAIYCIANLAIIGGLFPLLYLAIKAPLPVAIIVPVLLVYLISAIVGLIMYYMPNIKDGEGEFVV